MAIHILHRNTLCGRVVKTDRPMGGRRAQKPGQTLSKVLAGGTSAMTGGK